MKSLYYKQWIRHTAQVQGFVKRTGSEMVNKIRFSYLV